jgi:hypothetical protein
VWMWWYLDRRDGGGLRYSRPARLVQPPDGAEWPTGW